MDSPILPLPLSTSPSRQPPSTSATPPSTCRLSVVVVDYHQSEVTVRLVRQLQRSLAARDGSTEIIVLENAARTGTRLGRIRKRGVRLRRSRRNHGFARAVNRGSELARGSWLLLLNPDITLPEEFLDQVSDRIDRLEAQPEVGIVGLGLTNPDGTHQHSAGPFPTFSGTLARLLLPRARRKYHLRAIQEPTRVDWVTGCCLLIRRTCWEQLGGFDPTFFLYYEDVDLCRRATQAGWCVLHEPGLSVTHHHPLHGRTVLPHLRLITRHALLTYARKHWTAWQLQLLAGMVRLEGWARSLWAWLRGRRNEGAVFSSLAAVAGDLAWGRTEQAESRLQEIVQRYEEQYDATTAVGYRSQPSSH